MAFQDSLDQLKNFDASDLDVNNIGTWPSAVKGILMFLVLALVLGLGYSLYLTDKRADIERAELKQQELRKDYEGKFFKAANLDAYRLQKEEMEDIMADADFYKHPENVKTTQNAYNQMLKDLEKQEAIWVEAIAAADEAENKK